MDEKLKKLHKEIDCQWRVQSFSKNKASAQCVAYIDARDVMDVLDEVVGAENWQDDYKLIDGKLLAGIGIRVRNVDNIDMGWVWKWDTGTESNMEAEKGQMSDAFKRAAVKWGIGRFLYSKKIMFVETSEPLRDNPKNYPYVIGKNNERIWDLTEYIKKISK